MDGRDEAGRFQRGCPPGPGRPPRPTEMEYLKVLSDGCPPETWARIVARAVADAEAGDARAREWLTSYLLGSPDVTAPTLEVLARIEQLAAKAIASVMNESALAERVKAQADALAEPVIRLLTAAG